MAYYPCYDSWQSLPATTYRCDVTLTIKAMMPKTNRITFGLTLCALVAMPAGLSSLTQAVASAPHSARLSPLAPPQPTTRESDRNTIQLNLLKLEVREHNATHVGRLSGKVIVDLSPEIMRALVAVKPGLKPASDLILLGQSESFTLVTVDDPEWKGKNKARIDANIYLSSARFSGHGYTATRGKSGGWELKHGGLGCGFWGEFTLQSGSAQTVIKPTSRRTSKQL